MLQNVCESFPLTLIIFTILSALPMSIGQLEEADSSVSQSWGSTDLQVEKLRYTYIINQFKYCCQKVDDIVISPIFSGDGDCQWRLEIFPKGESMHHKNHLALYLRSVNCNAKASVRFSILNTDNIKSFDKVSFEEYKPSDKHGYPDFLSYKDLLLQENGLLPNDRLTIVCDIAILLGRENYEGKLSWPKSHFTEDLSYLLNNQELSDVTLVAAGGRKFKAHKAILAARSPVFKAMFLSEEGNKTIDLVEVSDLDYNVMNEMLRYIYTDKILGLDKLAPNLLVAAKNYELDGLKTISENTLRSNLSIENAVDYFILGSKYCAVDLKRDAKHFIASKSAHIKNTTAFEHLILTQPRLAIELFK